MARQNFKRDKQQRDMAKKRKREEKLQRKTARSQSPEGEDALLTPGEDGVLAPADGASDENENTGDSPAAADGSETPAA